MVSVIAMEALLFGADFVFASLWYALIARDSGTNTLTAAQALSHSPPLTGARARARTATTHMAAAVTTGVGHAVCIIIAARKINSARSRLPLAPRQPAPGAARQAPLHRPPR